MGEVHETLVLQVALLWVLNGVQGCLVLVVLASVVRSNRRIAAVEVAMAALPEVMRRHDDELLERTAKQFYDQVSRLMYEKAERRVLQENRRRESSGKGTT